MTDNVEDRSLESKVRAQYESFPYPNVPTGESGGTAMATMPSDLLAINHYLFAGGRDYTKPFRILVAGGGTGVATARLAQQLEQFGCPSTLTYIDLSTASREVAERRAKSYGLNNIEFLTGSLLDLPEMDLGELHRLRRRVAPFGGPRRGVGRADSIVGAVRRYGIDALCPAGPGGYLPDTRNNAPDGWRHAGGAITAIETTAR